MRRALILVSRALRRRCPACGAPIFASWFALRQSCPGCGLVLEREEGYFTGALAFNIIFAELVWIATFVGILLATWPTPPWEWLRWGSVAGMILVPIVFYPFSKTLWLAFDLYFRPVERQEFERHGRGGLGPRHEA
jgi:uncharacterized protein (DUF983 family)